MEKIGSGKKDSYYIKPGREMPKSLFSRERKRELET